MNRPDNLNIDRKSRRSANRRDFFLHTYELYFKI